MTASQRALLALAACGLLAACNEAPPPVTTTVTGTSETAVLGNSGKNSSDAAAQSIPRPPLAAGIHAQLVPAGSTGALALWVQDGDIMAASYTPERGWLPAQPLERIYGDASEPQLAGDGKGRAMAVWHHTVGKIHSLRFSRYEAGTGWSVPDVMPGALPRTDGDAAALQLRMDAAGQAYARWPSGFDMNEMQSSRFVAGQGWSRAVSEPVATVPPASAAGGG